MSLNIKQYDGKWQVEILAEVWEFKTKQDFERCLKRLIDDKSKYGQLKKNNDMRKS